MTSTDSTTAQSDTDKIVTRIERMVKLLNEATGIGFTFGYIGNLSGIVGTPACRDDRCWFVFAPHPGRVGTADDRMGGFDTANLDALLPELVGALKVARMVAARAM